jgi:hypothetical protein
MEKKLYRSQSKMIPIFLTGLSLSYLSLDNIFNGPLRDFLSNYISLNEFGSNVREEVLYYIILFVGGFQLFTAIQSYFQPIIEITQYKIAMRTSEKLFTVVKSIQELRQVSLDEEYLKFLFDDGEYSVFIQNIDEAELQTVLDNLNA